MRKNWKQEEGFSMIELLVTLFLISILSTLSLTAFRSYDRAQDFRGATREVVALLRNAQVRSMSEANTYQCAFTDNSLKIYRDAPTIPPPAGNLIKTYSLTEPRFGGNLVFVHAAPWGFTDPGGSGKLSNCLFYARGSTTAGTIQVKRIDTGQTREVTLDGLTGRVTYDE